MDLEKKRRKKSSYFSDIISTGCDTYLNLKTKTDAFFVEFLSFAASIKLLLASSAVWLFLTISKAS